MIEAASHANEHDGVTRVTRNRPASKPVETSSSQKTILDRIVEARRASIAHRKHSLPEAALKFAVEKAPPPRDFPGALSRDAFNVIAELKKASPSRGVLRENYAPGALAAGLESAGAAALSVLTEEDFFLGSLGDLKEAKKATQIPILRKDFIVDPWQVLEARAAGADAFLLIVAILDDATLRELLDLGRSLKMEALVEVHSREETRRAAAAGARIIGVNNRDLRDFSVRIETSLELIEADSGGLHSGERVWPADTRGSGPAAARGIRCVPGGRASYERCRSGEASARASGIRRNGRAGKRVTMVKVKICGITNWTDAKRAIDGGADLLGFNFYARSPRYITPAKARRIVRRLPKGVSSVGVFVNETEEKMLEIAAGGGTRPPSIAR